MSLSIFFSSTLCDDPKQVYFLQDRFANPLPGTDLLEVKHLCYLYLGLGALENIFCNQKKAHRFSA